MKKWFVLERFMFSREVSRRLAYKFDFFFSLFTISILQIIIPLYVLLLYGVSDGFPGWSVGQALLLVSYISLGESISAVFFQGIIWNTVDNVKKGTMDTWLLAPMHPLAYFINRSVDVEDTGKIVTSAAMTGYALFLLEATILEIAFLLLYLIVPIVFFTTLAILASATSILFIDSYRIYEFVNLTSFLSKYPLSIYPALVQTLFFTLVPLAAIGVVPILLLYQSASWILLASALVVFVLCALSILWWNNTLKNYGSAGG